MKIEKITVVVKDPPTQGQADREVFASTSEAVATLGEEATLKRLNYGHDLFVRRDLRERLLKAAEGPEKAIAKAVKALVALGLSESAARAEAERLHAANA